MKNKLSKLTLSLSLLALFSCGGSGGGGGSASGSTYLVQAPVQTNGCGDRIAPVNQYFTIRSGGDGVIVDTTIADANGVEEGGTIQAGYVEANGGCTREHNITINGAGDDSVLVDLSSKTTCDNGVTCTNTWSGTGTRTTSPQATSGDLRVRGENCIPPVPDVGYRPSVFECNGTSAVLMRNRQRNNYSVVVRRNGQFNDRDPNNPLCGTNECSPYKTQKRMELPSQQVNCLGDSGFSALYDSVLRISIKYTALVTNANDSSQFEQYCVANPEVGFN